MIDTDKAYGEREVAGSEDDALRGLFGSYDPELSSEQLFIARLENRLEEVELVRRHNLEQLRRGRRAVVIASIVGFVCGILCVLAMPATVGFLSRLADAFTAYLPSGTLPEACTTAAWALSACATLGATFLTYDLTLAWRRTAVPRLR